MALQKLNFSSNWNKKLDCDVFSTIRLWNDRVHFIGREVEIYDNSGSRSLFKGYGEYIYCEPFYLNQLKEANARLDTGYSLSETKTILQKMYKDKNIDVTKTRFAYIIVRKVKKTPSQQSLTFSS